MLAGLREKMVMGKKFTVSLLALVFALALPMGMAFAAQSPNAASPNAASPNAASPNIDSPIINASNIEANTVVNSVDSVQNANVSSEGMRLSPHSGAMNLAAIAGATIALFGVAAAAAWLLHKKLHQ